MIVALPCLLSMTDGACHARASEARQKALQFTQFLVGKSAFFAQSILQILHDGVRRLPASELDVLKVSPKASLPPGAFRGPDAVENSFQVSQATMAGIERARGPRARKSVDRSGAFDDIRRAEDGQVVAYLFDLMAVLRHVYDHTEPPRPLIRARFHRRIRTCASGTCWLLELGLPRRGAVP